MLGTNLFLLFTCPLEQARLDYMVTGSIASTLYGEPRLTNDVDIVIDLLPNQCQLLTDAFSSTDFYLPPLETLQEEAKRTCRGYFNIIHFESGFKADFYISGSDPLNHEGMRKRRSFAIGETTLWVSPPEYVIVRKLMFYREGGAEKHLRDIRAMLFVSKDKLDLIQVERLVEELRLGDEWSKAMTYMIGN